ncbi:hypothetical protein BDV36DRAFT_302083 [Aspergillus pseudocaelatus]|uniref:NADP-dependent oxidoreductase domain-containing protein n=1 Tax=Aspergillus pseudocaelatus TaxID=1825620 RepID=A0ABQ6W2A8_9EURO|nr:hypothetical protein BDV36DRAFT_302083 [Aspergillus pseudocaelatus]
MAAATLLREVPGGCTQSDPLRACLLRRRHADPGPPPSAEQQQTSTKTWELVEKINTFAKQRGATSAQLALAWIRAHSNTENCGTIIPIPGATAQSRVEENCQVVEISTEEKNRLDEIIKSIEVVGERQIVEMSDEHL